MLAGVLVAVATLSACTAASAAQQPAPAEKKPNIVYFLVDDMSADLLQYMDTVKSLADGGARFDNYFVSNSLCCPSRASMFTGEHPHNTGVLTNKGTDNGGYEAFKKHEGRTYAAALHDARYRTGYLGKYINEYTLPADYHVPQGWDEWHAGSGGAYNEFQYQVSQYIREENKREIGDGGGKYFTDLLGDRAVNFIERSRQHAPDRPFFLQVAAFSPHSGVKNPDDKEPLFPPAIRDRPKDRWPGGEFPHGDCGGPDCRAQDLTKLPAFDEDTSDKPSWVRREPLAGDEKLIQALRNDFRNRIRMVQSIDDAVARVLSSLNEAEKNNTYFVFTSDNGFHLGQHRLMRGKTTAYDHDVRVPMLVKRPQSAQGGTSVRGEIVQNVDLFATFLDIAGVRPELRDSRDGRSLLPMINGQTPPNWRNAALIEHVTPNPNAPGEVDPDAQRAGGNSNPPTYQAVRLPHELYVEYANAQKEREYYDMSTDPNQETNKPNDPRAGQLAGPLRTLANCGQPDAPDCWTASHIG
ncbi:arylsulfatase A-like enzyme [Herbihabitans rhizosphaerae]|uniref:Arylsulfatase A-like enzyme n=2 Tax=Herbihabitans rhizosphaerae TaxID=1872711 RepID=A0A4Q7KVZ7_9PSEU|nr:arylsulfatase A-like enzyme [Herbihabitans rhizosphaerae]